MIDPDLLTYYADLLIIQYKIKDKARDTIKLLVNQALCDGLLDQEKACFDLDTAEGAQLDIIGRIVGVPRNVYGLDLEHIFFNFTRAATTPASNGFARSAVPPYPDGILWVRAKTITASIYTLTDYEMLILIRLKILLNTSNSSFYDIINILYQFFPEDISVVDNQDMTLTYTINSALQNVAAAAVFLGFIPKPMGVEAEIVYT